MSLYIHVPFCGRKCLFCSFVIAVGQEHRRDRYVLALSEEMRKKSGASLQTIYFGGGTPSMLDENHFASLFAAIRKNFIVLDDAEIALEANPETLTITKAKSLKSLGFNRVSLGVQSLDDRYLKFLGRSHDAAKAREAYGFLRQAGFSNINLDLMYGFPGQSGAELEADVRALASMGSEHLSLYTLTIEPNSRFHASRLQLDDGDKLAEHYLMISRLLENYGFGQYEISNFARPGFESEHNKNYWRGTPYIGIGMGAHGFDGRRRYWNTPRLGEYLERIERQGQALEGCEDLSPGQLLMEKILFGLRMNQGISFDLLPVEKQALISQWINDGFLVLEGKALKTTERGRLVLDELCSRLI